MLNIRHSKSVHLTTITGSQSGDILEMQVGLRSFAGI